MYLGRIVEMGATEQVFAAPQHPYTQALLSALPSLRPGERSERITLSSESFDPAAPLREIADGHLAAI
jgi:oligopeptide/dipeptide ABC transporter ATP-binding protein